MKAEDGDHDYLRDLDPETRELIKEYLNIPVAGLAWAGFYEASKNTALMEVTRSGLSAKGWIIFLLSMSVRRG